ncbi:acyltransferase family protein [Winogradskyella sp. DF17]|uniref:Acyltransferase family protein n=1 Tax=Winogradskyella pelagia TaxID=2819984 RepID=A0ABS3T203_9FLAO|nr:acyltransferase family protein [Winogradskyella sp. DF17]MBO3116762.1 acyltransferase family protein [Winogradskyella sp. DF17]
MKGKITWINSWKGIGILCVVLGHIFIGETSRTIYIFHMPLFFFISGFLFKPTHKSKKYFTRKAVSFLVPYIAFLIPLYFVFTDFSNFELKDLASNFIPLIVGGRMLQGPFGVFWFITCLFLTQQVMNFLFLKLKSSAIAITMCIMLVLAFLNSIFFPSFWLPWNANVVLAAAPIFYLGYIYKKRAPKFNMSIVIILGLFVVLLSFVFPSNTYDMKSASYGIPLITMASAIILVLSLKFIAVRMSANRYLNTIFSELGKASLTIMYLHLPIIVILETQFPTIHKLFIFMASVVLSYFTYALLLKSQFTRGIFLGKPKALSKIFRTPSLYNAPVKTIETIKVKEATTVAYKTL